MTAPPRGSRFAALAPGILVAATGVGAGDLLTASLGGSIVGLTLLWAAFAGSILKWFLNEGIARWQMATGSTLLEGWVMRFGPWPQWLFLIYLLGWSVITGGALVNACGAAGAALFPITGDAATSKIVWGIAHSGLGLVLVFLGGFKLFSRCMSVCIGLMFVCVVATAALMNPDWTLVAQGLLTPSIPKEGIGWLLGILGGVGGTVTLLSSGYWIREHGRTGAAGVRACRIDLAVGYTMTALFGASMIIIGSNLDLAAGANLVLELADQLANVMGTTGKWVFLIGFWGAVFSSLLGVWQSVPYLFADFMAIRRSKGAPKRLTSDLAVTAEYRVYLVGLAVIPIPLLWMELQEIQLAYAVLGAFFMPLLALTLIMMNSNVKHVGRAFRSGWVTNGVLVMNLVFFGYVGVRKAAETVAKLLG